MPRRHVYRWFAVATILTLLSSLSFGQVEIPTDPQKFHFILLAGQSNMAGRGRVEASDRKPIPGVLSLNESLEWEPAVAPLHFDKPKIAGVGPGRSFAAEYVRDHPNVTVGLIPCAVGGSPISSWSPGGFHEQTGTHPFDDAIQRIHAVQEQGIFKAILWNQGGSDSKEGLAESYEAKLARLIDRLRASIGVADIPFIIGQMGDFPGKPWNDSRLLVDKAHQRIAAMVNDCGFVRSSGLSSKDDQIHFSRGANLELGGRYYQAFVRTRERQHPRLIRIQRIWDKAPHNAFTDLIRYQGHWYCVFREGRAHVSEDGKLRVLRSSDGQRWSSVALLENSKADLRDAKLSITSAGELMLVGAAAWQTPQPATHQTFAWFSGDGRSWSDPQPIGEPNYWLWRVTWNQDRAFGIGYRTGGGDRQVRLYSSTDGKSFDVLQKDLFSQGYPNESSLVFLPNGLALCLLRRDPSPQADDSAMLGRAVAPYDSWDWKEIGTRVGGPALCLLPDGRIIAAVRLYDGHVRTSLCWLDPRQASLHEFLRLPSAGDTSYAGMVWHDERLYVSYYSSHESQTDGFRSAIYFAEVAIP